MKAVFVATVSQNKSEDIFYCLCNEIWRYKTKFIRKLSCFEKRLCLGHDFECPDLQSVALTSHLALQSGCHDRPNQRPAGTGPASALYAATICYISQSKT